jgi:hypothetical protein
MLLYTCLEEIGKSLHRQPILIDLTFIMHALANGL